MDFNEERVASEQNEAELDPGIQELADLAGKMGENGESEYDENGFDANGMHKDTGTKYDPEGYDKDGFDEINVDREGFDREGFGTDDRDRDGYDREGYDKNGYDREGFNIAGLNIEGYDREGRRGLAHRDADGYDPEGFDRYGYDREGYNRRGFDIHGRDRDGFDNRGYDKEGYDRRGFDRQYYGIHSRTGTKYNSKGWDVKGFNEDGWDRDGYDRDGYDDNGYDRRGFDRQGFNADGYDRDGFDRDGFSRGGYDKEGYNREGLDRDGYTREYNAKFNKYGIDEMGYFKNGEMDPDVQFAIEFAESGVEDQGSYAFEKKMDENDVRKKIAAARKKCPNIDEMISDILLTGNKKRVANIINECNEVIDESISADEFWELHPKLTIGDILSNFLNSDEDKKQFADKTIEGIVMDSDNIEKNIRIFNHSRFDVPGALKGIEDFKKVYTRFSTDGSPEEIKKKQENTKKIFDTMKYFNLYKNDKLNMLLGTRQSNDGGQTWVEFTGENIGEAMEALKKDNKLICLQTVKDYIINNHE